MGRFLQLLMGHLLQLDCAPSWTRQSDFGFQPYQTSTLCFQLSGTGVSSGAIHLCILVVFIVVLVLVFPLHLLLFTGSRTQCIV
jgi:hypothetical protein